MIFVGGTGRSGTTVVARMFQQDPRFAVFIEPRFLVSPGGMMDYAVNQTIDRQEFVTNMKERFLPRLVTNLQKFDVLPNAESVYTHKLIDQLDYRAGLASHQRGLYTRLFSLGLFSEIHKHINTHNAVHKTPHSILWAGYLAWIFPSARFVHVIRDPRDICASVLEKNWGPRNARAFVPWYNKLMTQAWDSSLNIPGTRYLTLSLDRLVDRSRKTMRRLCAFAREAAPTGKALGKVDELVSVFECHRGRYKHDLSEQDARLIYDGCWERYQTWLDRSIA